MLSLAEYEAHLVALCTSPSPESGALLALGGDEFRWLRYRNMVRRRLRETLHHAFPRLLAALGDESFEALVTGFLAGGATRSPILRDVALEFEGWLLSTAPALPPFGGDLARLEWSELAVVYAEDDPGGPRDEPAMDRPVVLTLAHRLLRLGHAVHRFDPAAEPSPAVRPVHLCVYRDPATRRATVLEVTPVGFDILEELTHGRTLAEALRGGAKQQAAVVNREFIEATGTWLADLHSRGILIGPEGTRIS